jgi:hypothetical protein
MRLCIFTLVFVLISSASAQALDASNSGQPSCVAHPGDEHGYLLKVCEYLQTHHIQATSDPNTWSIRRIESTRSARNDAKPMPNMFAPDDVRTMKEAPARPITTEEAEVWTLR